MQVKRALWAFKLILTTAPLALLWLLLLSALALAQVALTLYVLPRLLTLLALSDYQNTLQLALFGVVTEALILSATHVCNYYYQNATLTLVGRLKLATSRRLAAISYAQLENPEYLQEVAQVKQIFEQLKPWEILLNLLPDVLKAIIALAGLGLILFQCSYLLLIVLGFTLLIGFVLNFWLQLLTFKHHRRMIPINRVYQYYFSLLFDPRRGQEMRLGRFFPFVNARFNAYQAIVLRKVRHHGLKCGLLSALILMVETTQLLLIYYLVARQTLMNGDLGAFMLYTTAATTAGKELATLFKAGAKCLIQLQTLSPLAKLFQEPPEAVPDSPLPLNKIHKITFDHVCFTYPGQIYPILDHLSFTLESGAKVALVGPNGAGKSTIIKLICGFYQPTSGRILINDQPLNRYAPDAVRAQITAIFQDYSLLPLPIADNVGQSGEARKQAYRDSGIAARINALAQGEATILDKVISSGITLSGGEGQKLALARALAKPASLLICDEPNSSLDAQAEAENYQHLSRCSKHQITLYVSHRLASCQFCDLIFYLESGRLAEQGSHQELLNSPSSRYRALYLAQAALYQNQA